MRNRRFKSARSVFAESDAKQWARDIKEFQRLRDSLKSWESKDISRFSVTAQKLVQNSIARHKDWIFQIVSKYPNIDFEEIS